MEKCDRAAQTSSKLEEKVHLRVTDLDLDGKVS